MPEHSIHESNQDTETSMRVMPPPYTDLQASPSKTTTVHPGLESQQLLTLADNTNKQTFILVSVLGDLWSNPV